MKYLIMNKVNEINAIAVISYIYGKYEQENCDIVDEFNKSVFLAMKAKQEVKVHLNNNTINEIIQRKKLINPIYSYCVIKYKIDNTLNDGEWRFVIDEN